MSAPRLAGVLAAVVLLTGACAGDDERGAESPNRGFVSLNANVACGFGGDGTMRCWADRSHREDSGERFIAIDGSRNKYSARCGIHHDGVFECWGGHSREVVDPDDPWPGYEEFPFAGEKFTSLSAGHFACAVRTDGALRCTSFGYPVRWEPPVGEFVAVSVARSWACAIRTDGTLACWSGDERDEIPPTPAGRFVAVSVGDEHLCAVRVGGALVCWGDDESGKASPPPGEFLSVAVTLGFSCGIRADSEVVCWGQRDILREWYHGWNNDGGLWPHGPFTALDVTDRFGEICALRASGEIVCWNNGTATHHPPGGEFVALDAGDRYTCGLRPTGAALCWGHDIDHEHYEPPDPIWLAPLQWRAPPGRFTAISAGDDGHACGLRTTGAVRCWGHDDGGGRTRTPPGLFTAISAGEGFSCGLRTTGDATCWGTVRKPYPSSAEPTPAPTAPPGPFTAIAVADGAVCGLRTTGEIACWNARTGDHAHTLDGAFAALTGGTARPCGLRPDGQLHCQDATADSPPGCDHTYVSFFGRLAECHNATVNSPGGTYRAVSGWNGHLCGLRPNGDAECWHATRDDWHEPTPPGPFNAITVGAEHACALRPNGQAECWTPHWPPTANPARA